MHYTSALKHLTKQKIVILGLGAEGWSTYQFLRSHLPKLKLAIADQRSIAQLNSDQQTILQQDSQLTLLLGSNYLDKINKFDLIFKAPGIPKSLPAIKKAIGKGAQLASNTQLFFELCPGKIIGITGTKGKSTTAAVIHHVLQTAQLKTLLLGNIGTPALSQLEQIEADTLVVYELSSHQLETLTISPYVAVIQDITSEHLDYYADTKEYQIAKTAITRWQHPRDIVIYNPQFAITAKIASLSPGKHLRHSLHEGPDNVAFMRQDTLMYRHPGGQVSAVLPANQLPLPGQHNLYNVLPTIIVGHLFNVDTETITQALKSFKPLSHRLELVLEKQGVSYYDDSLATNPFATLRALESFTKPLILIAGGHERDQDFTDLARVILEKKVIGLVLFKPTGQRLQTAIKQIADKSGVKPPPMKFAKNMPEAVKIAHQFIPTMGGIVLMSPASASFGLFENYHDRGMQFQEAVRNITA
ncbi:MAG: UDP-N-acetylmuramoylalanine--D-glutamate ligase [Candidatus Pacebacteria bacterium RIFOXYB1_FULL_39_46]|nr:MAG: UDP-N-acetylmuramoylalanine--D-glutamate ligase [Candidatus Pacebacteria bacterium RIFOXYA1_FULL_38_18]OGJ38413.1 MAG: UDP-N-acetylmuramoylalanine--D-glutamate ligase [Candidatus Pacebacteria bacterium RIFOXYB1_FULL_39_46]OGJ40274.1 MAG: UDP-N-acetylmuramoylalanine--D-glutamate ligase [Candidatus Pacebacteria bacterium RIFOXYC1_FULL_39_21]OGJ40847.1 MAG: UDP-N-acetylmuramoylalanine--D-glutamate ligase [Candidatus Pacebacteria bacterium RIFOXYD1_FULL_39_27]